MPFDGLVLRDDEVHVWAANLDTVSSDGEDGLEQILSSDERSRAHRLRREIDRHRFVQARGLLRRILAAYLHKEPTELQFRYNRYGKPFLAADVEAHDLRFNLSHSDGVCLYAISWHREVGIDIERIRKGSTFDWIAARFFSPVEVSTLRALPEDARLQAFFRYWTRKEACLKAKGIGLCDARAEVGGWRVEELCAEPGFAAALAAEGQDWRVFYYPHGNGSFAVRQQVRTAGYRAAASAHRARTGSGEDR